MWINGARGGDRLGSTNRLPAGDERLRYSYQRLTHLGHRRRFREIASLPQAAPCPPLVRFCARRELDRWLHSSIVSERIALMPRAGPLRAIRNAPNAYKATSASRSPEFNASTKSLWRSSGNAAEFTLLLLLF